MVIPDVLAQAYATAGLRHYPPDGIEAQLEMSAGAFIDGSVRPTTYTFSGRQHRDIFTEMTGRPVRPNPHDTPKPRRPH